MLLQMDTKISVIVVDDFEVFRLGLRMMLKQIDWVEKLAEARNSDELFKLIPTFDPDIIFMDVNLENELGIDITRKVLQKYPNILVVAVTSSKDVEDFINMIDAGAVGFLLKNVSHTELELALKEVINGNMYFSKEFLTAAKHLIPRKTGKPRIHLTDREKEILQQICYGYSNLEIAQNLNISTHTVDAHRKNLLAKTGSKNTANMIMTSLKNGLVDVEL